MAVNLKELAVVRQETGEYLGYLVWYTVAETWIDREKLKNLLAKAGLGEEWLPREIRAVDAFRKATKQVEKKREVVGDGIFCRYMMREVHCDLHSVTRHLVKEIVDSKGKRLDYNPNEAVLVLNKDTKTVEVESCANSKAQDICREILMLFEIFRTHHDARAIRSMIYNMLSQMAPTPLRPSGGVYFVPRDYEVLLKKMVAFLRSLGGRSEGFMAPLVDQRQYRDYIREKLQQYMEDTVANLARALKNGDPDRSDAVALVSAARQALSNYREYKKLLDDDLSEMRETALLIQRQVENLLQKVS